MDELLFERLNEEKFRKLSKREKRDTLAHIEKVMNNVHGEINSLAVILSISSVGLFLFIFFFFRDL